MPIPSHGKKQIGIAAHVAGLSPGGEGSMPQGGVKASPASSENKREKRTITEIRELKKTGEKMVYMSVPDYTSAKWAEMAGVDVAVVGDSLAMIAHGHPNTIPATMDMMVMHAQAIRRGAPNTFVLGCMPYQSYNTVDRALINATRFMQQARVGRSQAARRQVAGAYSQGAGRCRHPHRLAYRAHPAHHCDVRRLQDSGAHRRAAMKILEDALAIEDAGCFMLEFEAVPAKIAKLISEQLAIPTIGIGAGAGTDGQILLCHDLLGVFTDFKPKFTKRYAKLTEVAVAGISQYIKEVKEGSFPDDEHSYSVKDEEYEKFAQHGRQAQANLVERGRRSRSSRDRQAWHMQCDQGAGGRTAHWPAAQGGGRGNAHRAGLS